MPKTVTQTAESALESARDTIDDMVEKVRDMKPAQKAKRRHRPLPLLLLVMLGLGAFAWFMYRRRLETDAEIAPDVFGNAVEEQRATKAESAASMRP